MTTFTNQGILSAIGATPLVRLHRYLDAPDVKLWAKIEAANPGGSAKDRPARQMIGAAIASGRISKRTTVIESSSGNMGIGLAQVCRYHGLRFICVVDPHAQPQNVAIMRALGAEIDLVEEPVDGDFLTARLARVHTLLEHLEDPFWPNQYANDQNPLAHQLGTIREVCARLGDEVDYIFVATSSTGTARGCRDYLRKIGHPAAVVAIDAVGSVLFGGSPGVRTIPGLGAGQVPALAESQHFDGLHRVSDIDCVVGCRRCAEREAFLVGGSGGGVLEAIHRQSPSLSGKTCVAILHDSGSRYLDTVYSDEWVERTLGYTPEEVCERVRSVPASNRVAVEA